MSYWGMAYWFRSALQWSANAVIPAEAGTDILDRLRLYR